jgi:hypothetical protein
VDAGLALAARREEVDAAREVGVEAAEPVHWVCPDREGAPWGRPALQERAVPEGLSSDRAAPQEVLAQGRPARRCTVEIRLARAETSIL